MASVSLLIIFLHSFLLLCNYFSIKPFLKDFVMEQTLLFLTSPGSSQHTNIVTAMTADLRIVLGLQWFFFLALSIAFLLSSATTILATAVTYGELDLSFKSLLLRVLKLWKRPIITWFYICIFYIGYVVFASFSVVPFTFQFGTPSHPTTFVYAIWIPAAVFYMYLAVDLNLSIVISVLEEKSGFEAFGKASQLSKGMKVQGFLLNLVFEVLVLIVYKCWDMMKEKSGINYFLLMSLLSLNIGWLIKMASSMAFAVFYHVCKQALGEEIELQRNFEYTKVSNQPLIGAELP